MSREQFQTLSEPMFYILLALEKECCGVDIMERVESISKGRVKVGPGTLYTLLDKFKENKIIHETAVEGRKRWYIIADEGEKLLAKEISRLKTMLADKKDVLGD